MNERSVSRETEELPWWGSETLGTVRFRDKGENDYEI